MVTTEQLRATMAQCYGTEQYHRDYLLSYIFTDGVLMFAKTAECYWFLQEVNGMIVDGKIRESVDELATVTLLVKDDKATITIKTEDKKVEKNIPFTDCPSGKWTFFFYTKQNILIWEDEY